MTQMNISMKQKWTHRHREQIRGAKGQEVREGKIESLGSADEKLLYTGWIRSYCITWGTIFNIL